MSLIFYPIIVFYIFFLNSMYCGTKFLISILCTCSSHSIHFIVVITHYKPYFVFFLQPKKVRRRKSGQSSLSLEANLAAKSAKKIGWNKTTRSLELIRIQGLCLKDASRRGMRTVMILEKDVRVLWLLYACL